LVVAIYADEVQASDCEETLEVRYGDEDLMWRVEQAMGNERISRW
jgi:hypothetical protein